MGFLPMVPMGVLVHPGHHGSVDPREFELGEMVNYTRDHKIWQRCHTLCGPLF